MQLEDFPTNAMLVLRDALGREVLQQRITDHYPSLSVSDFSSGLYLLEICSNGKRIGAQLVVVD